MIVVHDDVLVTRGKFEYSYSLWERLLFTFYGIYSYIVKLFLPMRLSAIYPFPERVEGFYPAIFYIAVPIVLILVFILISKFRKNRDIVFGCLFFLFTIGFNLPYSIVGQAILADRYLYLPSIGLFYIFALVLEKTIFRVEGSVSAGKTGKVVLCATIVYVVVLSGYCFERNKVWRDSVTLWNDVINKFPNTGFVYFNRANAYHNAENFKMAIGDYDRALELSTIYLHRDIYMNRGTALGKLERYEEAITDFSKALVIGPSTAIYNGRAIAYYQLGEREKAISDISKAIEINPRYVAGYRFRGLMLLKNQQFDLAINDFTKVLPYDSGIGTAHHGRSRAFYGKKDFTRALSDAIKAKKLGYDVQRQYVLQLIEKIKRPSQ